jgi:hypothetical protein
VQLSSNDCLDDKKSKPADAIRYRLRPKRLLAFARTGTDLTMRTEFHQLFAPGLSAPIILALSICAMPTVKAAKQSAGEVKASRVTMLCTKSSERVVSGLTKICYFHCGKAERALKVTTYEACPHRALRWQLNHDAAYGPSLPSR